MKPSNLDRISENNPLVSKFKEELLAFDSKLASGDGDGVLELTDLDSQSLSQKFEYLSKYINVDREFNLAKYVNDIGVENSTVLGVDQSLHLIKLGKTIESIRGELKLPPLKSSEISAGEILETFKVLFGDDYSSLAESTNEAKVRILGDSLTRGMMSTSDGGVGDPSNFLMAKILLDSMGIPLEESLALTQKEAFPYERSNIDHPGMMGFVSMGLEQALSLFFADGSYAELFPLSADQKSPQELERLIDKTEDKSTQEKKKEVKEARALVIGASASITSDVISDINDLSDSTASTGRSFIEKNYQAILKDIGVDSLMEMILSGFDEKSDDQLGIMMMMLGANDLFTIGGEKRIVNAPQQDPVRFRENIREIAAYVASAKVGVNFRPIFIAPFDVSAVLTPVSRLTKYPDLKPIPHGSMILHHHELIELKDGVLPRQVVFTPDDIAKMKEWQTEYTHIIQEELGSKQGWKVIELQKIFSKLVYLIKEKPITVFNVDGYGKLKYSFRDLFSMDNQHPSAPGYLLLALLQQALLMESGFALKGHEEFIKDLPTNSYEREKYILFWVEKKFGETIKKDPSFYRPQRMEIDELIHLDKTASTRLIARISPDDDFSYESLYPFLPDEILSDLLEVVSNTLMDENLEHHQKVDFLKKSMKDKTYDREEFHKIIRDWAEGFISHQYEIARVMDLNFKAFGGVSNDNYEGKRFGVLRNVRGLMDVDLAAPIGDDDALSTRLNIGFGLETNSLRLMGLTQNIILDGGLRFGYGNDQPHSAEVLINAGITTKLLQSRGLQLFNEARIGLQSQIDQIDDLSEDIGSSLSMTDQVRFLFTISDDLTGRDNSTQALYIGAENLSHFLEITPGELPPMIIFGGSFTYAF